MTRYVKGSGFMTYVRRHDEIATSPDAESWRERLVDRICLALFGTLLFAMAAGWLCVAGFLIWWLLLA